MSLGVTSAAATLERPTKEDGSIRLFRDSVLRKPAHSTAASASTSVTCGVELDRT
eukprot:CAMPEP_0177475914 /NCGR_PEP_ID=MMETSP0369-20130122/23291_1 /TAXON_ID=447022 ORGANISM="Scrippsiella hangoei-like, Strain SHHI-4" /NCGR_SAMPLE_ID=MMETSP0369 /ASSEMBLY_ACC=CAM_ASM_000364 /LENGTH=54 /DNA_ID=CAMNT_0018951077 /DNA_START=328 /DNA_END=488 /DNA_ORIENTATION=-